ncbi:hypothetical protein [Ramlibacter sp.]|uniref:hypothetical protein n=1 Tax=Ramlibacter sp. TaxID=1917967 RepID=UPI0035AE13B5
MTPRASLWREASSWRWIVVLAIVSAGLGLLGSPWRANVPTSGGPATYAPPAAPAPPPGAGAPTSTAVTPAQTSPQAAGSDAQAPSRVAQPATPAPSPTPAPAVPPPVTAQRQSPSTVVWAMSTGPIGGPPISGGGLITSSLPGGGSAPAVATKGLSSGRHYWEVMLAVQPGEPFASTWTAAGVVARKPEDEARDLIFRIKGSRDTSTVFQITPGRDRSIVNGDVLMFALDVDKRLMFWGHNGQWRNGVPGEAGGTQMKLAPGEQFFAFAEAAKPGRDGTPDSDRWIANFGGQKFKYALPAGFDSYGTTGRAIAAGATSVAPATARAMPAAAPPPIDTLIGKVMQGSVEVGSQSVPLPDGPWTVLAHFKGGAGGQLDSMVLGQLARKTLRRLVVAQAGPGTRPALPRSCVRQDILFNSNPTGGADMAQCWWINHATSIWGDHNLFRSAQLELEQRGIQASSVFINVGFHRSTPRGHATVFYYFDPLEEGQRSAATSWAASEWHKSRIEADPARQAYVQKLTDWGHSWAPIFYASR